MQLPCLVTIKPVPFALLDPYDFQTSSCFSFWLSAHPTLHLPLSPFPYFPHPLSLQWCLPTQRSVVFLFLFFVCLFPHSLKLSICFYNTLFSLFQVLESSQPLPSSLPAPVMAPPVSLWRLFMAFGIITPGTLPDCSYKASLPGNYYLQALSSSVLPPYRNPSVSSEQHNEEGI